MLTSSPSVGYNVPQEYLIHPFIGDKVHRDIHCKQPVSLLFYQSSFFFNIPFINCNCS